MLATLRAHRYADATDLLHAFVAAHAQVRTWEDPRLAALQFEIRRLEAERAEATRLLTAFELWHQRELGELLQEVLALRRDVARHQRHRPTPKASTSVPSSATSSKPTPASRPKPWPPTPSPSTPTAAPPSKSSTQLCHPDRVAAAHKRAATEAFQQLLSAYQRQDMAALQAQLLDLRRGIFTANTTATGSVELLHRRDALAATHAALLRELAELRASEALALAQADEAAREAYASANRATLSAERDRLLGQLERLAATVG